MEQKQKAPSDGFVRLVLLVIIILALLAYLKVDLRKLFNYQVIQKLIDIFVFAWGTYVKPLFVYLWTSISAIFTR